MLKKLFAASLLALTCLMFMGAGEYLPIIDNSYVSITLNQDSTKVWKVDSIDALDSFVYRCSVMYPDDTSLFDTITWVSPLQTVIVTVDSVIDNHAYPCTLDLGTNVYEFTWTSPASGTDTAMVCDSLTNYIDGLTGAKDTVDAQDSATYVKLVSKFAQIELEADARWLFGCDTELVDTSTQDQTDTAMVVDSMVAAINGLDSAQYWTAYDSGDFYIIEADIAGMELFAIPIDSAQDSLLSRDSATTVTQDSGTINIGTVYGYKTVVGAIVLNPIMEYTQAAQEDSGVIRLYATGEGTEEYVLAADSAASLPCTLNVRIADDIGDTLLVEGLKLFWMIEDTVSDTAVTVYAPLRWNLRLK